MAEDLQDEEYALAGQPTFQPASLPLGSLAPCVVSDQPTWVSWMAVPSQNQLTEPQETAIRAMVDAVSKADSLARRLEVETAWYLRLMDRGYHYIFPRKGGGWTIDAPGARSAGQSAIAYNHSTSRWSTNIIGSKNDTIVSALTRELPKIQAYPKRPQDDDSVTAADAANKYKWCMAQDADYEGAARNAARKFCTDERVAFVMQPVADCAKWGYEDNAGSIVPETEEQASAKEPSKTPRIRARLRVFGKLEHKLPVGQTGSLPYQQVFEEIDLSCARGSYPWVADKIKAGDMSIAEIQLDRIARASIKLATRGGIQGDTLTRECTECTTWLAPSMFMDDSCPKNMRDWFYETFPKGVVVIYAGDTLAFARNEAMCDSIHVVHAKSGDGQNRRAITEAYAGPNMRLNNWVELKDQYFRKGIPRQFLNTTIFNVPALRASSQRVGVEEPFDPQGTTPDQWQFSTTPAQQPAGLDDSINYFAGALADDLTGAQASLSGDTESDPETFGAAKLQNGMAMGRLSESWAAMCQGFAMATQQGIEWDARVQPEEYEFDRVIPGQGRIRGKVADMRGGILIFSAENKNYPESPSDKQQSITEMIVAAPQNQMVATWLAMPENASVIKQSGNIDLTIPGVQSVEKQEGEFELLLAQAPQPNPALAQLMLQMKQAQGQLQMAAISGQPVNPQMQQALQQLAQTIQQTPPQISSVPVRQDDSEEHAIEAAICLKKALSPEGRRMSNSSNPADKAAFQNLLLHRQQHMTVAKALAAQNAQPSEPKKSVSLQVDKLPMSEQPKILQQEFGVQVDPQAFTQPGVHEVTQETNGVTPQGVPIKQKVSLSGNELN